MLSHIYADLTSLLLTSIKLCEKTLGFAKTIVANLYKDAQEMLECD